MIGVNEKRPIPIALASANRATNVAATGEIFCFLLVTRLD
jgi:hypothetical protein